VTETHTTESPHVSLDRFFETAHAFHRTAALKAAIELDVFTAIGEGAATADVLAQRCHASERGMRILCDYLTVIGFLTKTGNHYALTQDSALFLDRRSPVMLVRHWSSCSHRHRPRPSGIWQPSSERVGRS
jgi:hypothetical protein